MTLRAGKTANSLCSFSRGLISFPLEFRRSAVLPTEAGTPTRAESRSRRETGMYPHATHPVVEIVQLIRYGVRGRGFRVCAWGRTAGRGRRLERRLPILMQAIACIFFRRVQVGNPLARWWPRAKNRPKTTRKTPRTGKTTCISVAILGCFAGGPTLALVAMGRPIRGNSTFHVTP